MKRVALVLAGLLYASTAHAHRGYPDKLATDVGAKMSPSCSICHVNPQGGGPLRTFGDLMVGTYGLDPSTLNEDDSSLASALAALKFGDPGLYADLQAGTDPNRDHDVSDHARESAEYGCAVTGNRRSGGWSAILGAIVGATVARLRLRRTRRGSLPRGHFFSLFRASLQQRKPVS
jgi:hypothetical protein